MWGSSKSVPRAAWKGPLAQLSDPNLDYSDLAIKNKDYKNWLMNVGNSKINPTSPREQVQERSVNTDILKSIDFGSRYLGSLKGLSLSFMGVFCDHEKMSSMVSRTDSQPLVDANLKFSDMSFSENLNNFTTPTKLNLRDQSRVEPSIKSPEFTDPKKKPIVERSTGELSYPRGLKLPQPKPDTSILSSSCFSGSMSKIQLNGSRTNFQRGKEVTSEWLGPTGINYLEHIPTELPSRERGKPLPEQLPTRSKNTIKDQNYVFQPLASVEDNSKRTNGLQQPLGFGLTRSRTDASMPVFREVGKNPLPQYGSPTSHSNHENGIEYKYYSVNSNSELVQSSRKDFAYGAEDQFQSLREPVDENWEGFSILKKYASKERLEMKTENNRKSVHNSRLIDKYADMNLAKAFFDSSPNKELAALATEATAEHQDKPRSSHLESQQRFSKLNTFGYISSDQAEPEETPETSKKFILSGFLDRRIPHNTPKLGPIDDQSYNRVNKDTNFGTERPTKSHQLHNRQQDRYLRDSDLEGLLGKVGRPTPEKQKRASNIKPEPKSDQYFEPSQPRFVTKLGYFNPPPVERDSEGTLSSPMMLTAPRFQSKTDSQKMPESKKPPFDRQMSQRRLDGGHSLRTVKVDISSLIQRTLIDLKR